MIEMEVNIYATNLDNKLSMKFKYSNKWRIGETNIVPTASAICGVKTEHSRLKPIETKNLSRHTDLCDMLTSLSIWGSQMEKMSKIGLADQIDQACHMGRFLIFPTPTPTPTFNSQTPIFIPAYVITLFVGILGLILCLPTTVFKTVPVCLFTDT
jgi:hypothetical protein